LQRDLGDFQTPPALVDAVLATLGRNWRRVLEPTCGRGHFLAGLLARPDPPLEAWGIERQAGHLEAARLAVDGRVGFLEANIFDLDLGRDIPWVSDGPLLVVGNPPWVTNSALGALGSSNHPRKSNAAGLRGIDARTGRSNFDLAEAVWLKLIVELADQSPTIALLCKSSVARRVFRAARLAACPVAAATFRRIDARRWFGAAVDAGLLRIDLAPGGICDGIDIYDALDSTCPSRRIGLVEGDWIADLDAHERSSFADGASPIGWRQGLKHDAAAVMELTCGADGRLRNGSGEVVDVEPAYVFPLLKSSDLAREGPPVPTRAVIVPQRVAGADTRPLERAAPRLWAYLQSHETRFSARKSSIYRGGPPFATFGVGPYAFSPWKVAVSGLHKEPRFRAVGPSGGRPVMLDDAGYLAPVAGPEAAALAAALLNGPEARDLLDARIFWEAKRPVTKDVLRRVDLNALWARADRDSTLERARAEWDQAVAPGAGPPRWPSASDLPFVTRLSAVPSAT